MKVHWSSFWISNQKCELARWRERECESCNLMINRGTPLKKLLLGLPIFRQIFLLCSAQGERTVLHTRSILIKFSRKKLRSFPRQVVYIHVTNLESMAIGLAKLIFKKFFMKSASRKNERKRYFGLPNNGSAQSFNSENF